MSATNPQPVPMPMPMQAMDSYPMQSNQKLPESIPGDPEMLTNCRKCCLKFLAVTVTKTTGAIFSLCSGLQSPQNAKSLLTAPRAPICTRHDLDVQCYSFTLLVHILSSLCPPTKHQLPTDSSPQASLHECKLGLVCLQYWRVCLAAPPASSIHVDTQGLTRLASFGDSPPL